MKKTLLFLLVLLSVNSCQLFDKFLNGDIVARVGKSILYESDIKAIIPSGISAKDSLNMLTSYINSWATAQLLEDVAEQKLPKNLQDVTKELNEYKSSLLVYRYQNLYVTERLDTLLSEQECEDYYKNNIESFITSIPIIQCRYVKINGDSPNFKTIKSLFTTSNIDDLEKLNKLCYVSADKYTDFEGEWVALNDVAKEIKLDLSMCEEALERGNIIENKSRNIVYLVFALSRVNSGEYAPYEYCKTKIKEIIYSKRKQELINNLEKNLLDDAYANDKLIIYTRDNE